MRESVPAKQDFVNRIAQKARVSACRAVLFNHRDHVTLERSLKILEYGLVGHDMDIGREYGLVMGRLKGGDAHVSPEESTMYPTARSPITGVFIGMNDANSTCIVTIANADDLATLATTGTHLCHQRQRLEKARQPVAQERPTACTTVRCWMCSRGKF